MSEKAVFYDPTFRRWRWIKGISTFMAAVSVVIVTAFLLSLFTTPLLPGMPGITSAIKHSLRRAVHARQYQNRLRQHAAALERQRLLDSITREHKRQQARAALPPVSPKRGIVAAFYAPWQETGLHSLKANAGGMTHLLPAWVHLQPDAKGLDFHDWDPELVPHNKTALQYAREANLNIVPVFSNAQQSEFDAKRVHVFLTHPMIQQQLIAQLRNWCLINQFQGINVDFENLLTEDYPLLVPFLQRMKTAFATDHLVVSADLEASKPVDWRAAAAVCDFVVVMAYDEHGEGGKPGPISSINWYRGVLQHAVRSIPRDKLVLGLGNYAYDWTEGNEGADPMTYQGALIQAKEYRSEEKPEQIVDFDPQALNPTFSYIDDEQKEHEVWMLDAVTAANQWMIAQNYGVRGVAVWVLGSTDPSIWKFLNRNRLSVPPNVNELSNVVFPYDVEFVGEGEILHVQSGPMPGARSLEVDPSTKLILDESYHSFPTSNVIARSGYREKQVVLTIDDGPAEPYTAQMLDVLKQYNVKATFFLIGENAERYPNLVKRIWREGHEIGNHSFTHPNMGTITESQAQLELNATQRVFQSLLHRSTLLFRPPYNADAEPDQMQEVEPIRRATEMKYITVGEFVDPQDWNTEELAAGGARHRRTADEMLQSVLQQIETEHGSCILLHDGGGDRSETVKLLPKLITELRKDGYRFVNVSDLINSSRDAVNPQVASTDTLMLASDRIVFEVVYLFELFLSTAFISAIALGTLRVLFITVMAIAGRQKEKRETFDQAYQPPVSVVIAAYNEEKVIARTIDAVLANDYPQIEVIVVDDGSKDDTAGEVQRRFAGRDHVRVIRQENAGKAAALNRGIAQATGEIIIALDADTLFARDAIRTLIRHFADPRVGAVAGNVKVGNRINPLTYWQAIEYVTSQNLDRRAYSVLNSVSVVPGAVGAWRRDAVLEAGGYTTDTMAEDMDLTWRIRRMGLKIDTESAALGFTEAPDSWKALYKQRFRWAFGTLQCLWKHRGALGRYGWFGRVMLPSLWLFQVAYQALSPLVDLQIVWTLGTVVASLMRGRLTQDWQPLPNTLASLYVIGFMYAFFFVVELVGSAVAFKLDREEPKMLAWLFWQRFLYRQLMYAVLLRSIKTAISGMRASWGKLERKGTVELAT